MTDKGMSLSQISNCLNMTVKHVSYVRNANGIRQRNYVKVSDYDSQIRTLVGDGYTFSEVANAINLTLSQVKGYCKRNRIKSKSVITKSVIDSAINKFNDMLNDFGGMFEYYDNFDRSKGTADIICKTCGHVKTTTIHHHYNRECSCCQSQLREQYACDEYYSSCLMYFLKEQSKDSLYTFDGKKIDLGIAPVKHKCVCIECGKEFLSIRKRSLCSDACRKERSNRRRRQSHSDWSKKNNRERIMRMNGEYDNDITLKSLSNRYDGTCAICGEPVDWNDFHKNDNGVFIAGDLYPSIDHIHPISRGGTHTWANVQLAHRICNSIKCDAI